MLIGSSTAALSHRDTILSVEVGVTIIELVEQFVLQLIQARFLFCRQIPFIAICGAEGTTHLGTRKREPVLIFENR